MNFIRTAFSKRKSVLKVSDSTFNLRLIFFEIYEGSVMRYLCTKSNKLRNEAAKLVKYVNLIKLQNKLTAQFQL